jgi:hypothetical protein
MTVKRSREHYSTVQYSAQHKYLSAVNSVVITLKQKKEQANNMENWQDKRRR